MKFKIGKWACSAAIAFTFLLVALWSAAQDKEPSKIKDKIAEVNGVTISGADFERELNFFLDQATRQGRPISDSMLPKVRDDILNNLIERELLYQTSQKEGIDVDAQAVADQLATIKKRFPNDGEFDKALSQMHLSESDVKSQIKRDMSIRELINKQVTQKIAVTDEETKSYYDNNPNLFKQPEQIKASHILIKVEADASEAQKAEARKEIEKIQQKLKNGEDFATLAKEFSQGPSNVNGGDLGYFKRGQMVKPFEDAAFAAKTNEVSDIVETQFGYHLILVVDKKPEQTMAYDEIKDRLGQHLKQKEVEKEAGLYIEKLKKDAKIEKYL